MKNRLDRYLKELQNSESIFPMDSIHTGKKLVLYKKDEKESGKKKENNRIGEYKK